MEPDQREHFQRLLSKIKRDLRRNIDRFNDEEKKSIKETTGELSSYDNHPADQATNTYEREKDVALKYGADEMLEMVDNALEKLNRGKFGDCERCGNEIGRERLESVPYTPFCRSCAEREEQFIDEGDRPYNEGVTDPPFQDSFTIGSDNVVYDGEDTWEDVSRYGTSSDERG